MSRTFLIYSDLLVPTLEERLTLTGRHSYHVHAALLKEQPSCAGFSRRHGESLFDLG